MGSCDTQLWTRRQGGRPVCLYLPLRKRASGLRAVGGRAAACGPAGMGGETECLAPRLAICARREQASSVQRRARPVRQLSGRQRSQRAF